MLEKLIPATRTVDPPRTLPPIGALTLVTTTGSWKVNLDGELIVTNPQRDRRRSLYAVIGKQRDSTQHSIIEFPKEQ